MPHGRLWLHGGRGQGTRQFFLSETHARARGHYTLDADQRSDASLMLQSSATWATEQRSSCKSVVVEEKEVLSVGCSLASGCIQHVVCWILLLAGIFVWIQQERWIPSDK